MKHPLLFSLLSLIATTTIAAAQQEPTTSASKSMIPVYKTSSLERTLLSDKEIKAALTKLPGWHYENKRLKKVFDCESFGNGIAFIVALSYICESIDHHPEIFSIYSKVEIATTSYDVGKQVSSLDVELAHRIESIACKFTVKP